MHRYRISYIAGGAQPATVEAKSAEAALAAANVLVAGVRELDGRGRVHFGHVMTDTGEILGCAAVVDRLPSDFGKGAYRTAAERAEKPQDKGGSTRKHRSPKPFVPRRGISLVREVLKPGEKSDAVLMPTSGDRPNRAENAAAQRELARAGLGTLNGVAVGGPMNVNPDHYIGVRTVESDSSAPLAILAARVTPCTEAESAARAAKGYDPAGDCQLDS